MFEKEIKKAKDIIINSNRVVFFTGAGISVASGIPAFRGENGLWSKYDPIVLDLQYFISNPVESYRIIREIFYRYMQNIKPNPAHYAIAEMGYSIITQNIDNLHQEAGSLDVVEFHGSAKRFICLDCHSIYDQSGINLDVLPPTCKKCGGLLKPDFVFFGEPIPQLAYKQSLALSSVCDVMVLVGTTGEIMPASQLPYTAKDNKAVIIEINIEKSNYTNSITDIFINDKAENVLPLLADLS